MDTIQTTMAEMMELFRNKTTAIESQLQKTSNLSTIEGLAAEFTSFKAFMVQALTGLQKQIEILATTMDRLDMHARRKMLLLHGLNEAKDEDLIENVTNTIRNQLGLADFSVDSIKRCYRLGRPAESQKNRPVVIKFQDLAERDSIWLMKRKLKGSSLTMSEFLTKNRHDIFMAARNKLGISKCWTLEGQIFVKDANDKRHKLFSLNDLNKIHIEEIPKQATNPKVTAPKSKRVAKR